MDFKLSEDEQMIQEIVRDLAQSRFKQRAIEIDEKSIFPSYLNSYDND